MSGVTAPSKQPCSTNRAAFFTMSKGLSQFKISLSGKHKWTNITHYFTLVEISTVHKNTIWILVFDMLFYCPVEFFWLQVLTCPAEKDACKSAWDITRCGLYWNAERLTSMKRSHLWRVDTHWDNLLKNAHFESTAERFWTAFTLLKIIWVSFTFFSTLVNLWFFSFHFWQTWRISHLKIIVRHVGKQGMSNNRVNIELCCEWWASNSRVQSFFTHSNL